MFLHHTFNKLYFYSEAKLPEKAVKMVQMLGMLPPTWETWKDSRLQASKWSNPGCCAHFRREPANWKSLSSSLPFSKSAFQIKTFHINKKKKALYNNVSCILLRISLMIRLSFFSKNRGENWMSYQNWKPLLALNCMSAYVNWWITYVLNNYKWIIQEKITANETGIQKQKMQAETVTKKVTKWASLLPFFDSCVWK